MNRDDIIRMAREAGWNGIYSKPLLSISLQEEDFLRFAALVAAAERKRIESTPWGAGKEWIARAVEAEREACAKVCEQEACACCWEDDAQAAAEHLAERIRARGRV